jgi:hypothetical protein
VCCDRLCNSALESCVVPGSVGTCTILSEAPAATPTALLVAAGLLLGIAGFAMARRSRPR